MNIMQAGIKFAQKERATTEILNLQQVGSLKTSTTMLYPELGIKVPPKLPVFFIASPYFVSFGSTNVNLGCVKGLFA